MKPLSTKHRPVARATPSIEALESRTLLNAGGLDVVLNGTGTATTAFTSGAAQVHAMAVQADGKIIIVGQAGSNSTTFALARFDRDGSLDSSFGSGGQVTTAFGSAQNGAAEGVVVQPDGKIVVAGFGGQAGSKKFALARYNSDGRGRLRGEG
jgi:uncharacterized delta-60 repeat protein